jgi:predicted O-linked N-acetylglucosamine transferase (SPINDLY family)
VDLQPDPPPGLESAAVTFDCLNNNAKITEKVVACRSKLQYALPQARLYSKSRPVGCPPAKPGTYSMSASKAA